MKHLFNILTAVLCVMAFLAGLSLAVLADRCQRLQAELDRSRAGGDVVITLDWVAFKDLQDQFKDLTAKLISKTGEVEALRAELDKAQARKERAQAEAKEWQATAESVEGQRKESALSLKLAEERLDRVRQHLKNEHVTADHYRRNFLTARDMLTRLVPEHHLVAHQAVLEMSRDGSRAAFGLVSDLCALAQVCRPATEVGVGYAK